MGSATASTGRLQTREPIPWINHALRLVCAIYLTLIVVAVVAYKSIFIEVVVEDPWFGVYSVVVCLFILSRFLFSLFYRPAPEPEHPLEPTVAVVMPAFNEEDAVANSIRSLLAVDYPREKLEIVVVNDGSTDGTLREICSVADQNRAVRVIGFMENRGKRAAMAAGIRATKAAVVAFVDSDSSLERDAMRKIVRGFADPRVGAIAGHAEVQNARESLITRMQAVRYFVAFRVCKAAESIFGACDVLLGLLLCVPEGGDRPGPGALGEPALPEAARHVRRRPLADQLRAAELEGHLRRAGPVARRSCRRTSACSCASSCAGSARGRASH